MTLRITLQPSGLGFETQPGETLLAASAPSESVTVRDVRFEDDGQVARVIIETAGGAVETSAYNDGRTAVLRVSRASLTRRFAGVVRNHPGRAGLFSSRANESSSTAPEVGSGGWLAYNFRRAVDGGVALSGD